MTAGSFPANKSNRSWASRAVSFCLHQLFAMLVCVGFPALVTAIAPVSWVDFERHDGRVSAHTRTCLLFVVPYKMRTIDPVIGLGDRFVAGTISHERRDGRDHRTKSEDEGFLIIRGSDQVAEVPVTPFNLSSVIERSEAFLNDPNSSELKLFVVANWKFSVIAGVLISLLTLLYVVGVTLGIVQKTVHVVQWSFGVPPESRWLVNNRRRPNSTALP